MTFDPLLNEMYDRVIERSEKYEPILVKTFPPLRYIDQPAWIGSQSWTLVRSMKRLLKDKNVVKFFPIPQSPSEFARDYLHTKFGEQRLRAFAEQAALIKAPRAAPLMAKPQVLNDHVYIDMKAAYWTIVQLAGWNVDYYPGRWIAQGANMEDWPIPEHKLARNCLPSVGRHTKTPFWTGESYKSLGGRNVLINNGLWALVQDVLHAIAWDMIELGACYVHTDGYILPASRTQWALEALDDWGVVGGVRFSGAGRVFGAGAYDLGEHRAHDNVRVMDRELWKINDVDRVRLKKYMRMWARRRVLNFG